MEEPFVHKIFIGKKSDKVNHAHSMNQPLETRAIEEKIWLSKHGLADDELAQKRSPERATYAYPIKHYRFWKEQFTLESLDYGLIGENFSVLEMDEFSVCIGDTYHFGDAIIQVSEPRLPCWQMSQRLQIDDFALYVQNSGRTGWYFRILQEGYVLSRIDIELMDRPYPEWTIAACNEVMHFDKHNLRSAHELLSCELLSSHWKKKLQKRLRGQEPSEQKRLFGS